MLELHSLSVQVVQRPQQPYLRATRPGQAELGENYSPQISKDGVLGKPMPSWKRLWSWPCP